MAHDDKDQKERKDAERPRTDSPAVEKARLLKRRAARLAQGKLHAARLAQGKVLRPDDIGVVRIEFTLPASRLFGSDSFAAGGGGLEPLWETDGDPNDDIFVGNTDLGPGSDKPIVVPWPPGTDPDPEND